MKLKICLIIASVFCSEVLCAQSNLTFTKSFTRKLEKANLEFYHSIERWLKVAPDKKDRHIKHDIVLHSPPDIEVRIKIWNSKKKREAQHPHVLTSTTLASIATNDDHAWISMKPLPYQEANELYGADRALIAEFTPKSNYSNHSKGRMLSIYNEDSEILVSYIILYDSELDPFFELPIRFRTNDHPYLEKS